MKVFLRFVSVFVLIGFFVGNAWADKPRVLPLKDLQSGTVAIGFSVFKGIEPQPFGVILGESIDRMGSRFILARISGGPMDTLLEEIGAVAGMSGSPIFVDCINKELSDKDQLDYCVSNGVLVGALSYGPAAFIKGGPNVLLTPAEYMLGARVGGYVAAAELSNRMPNKISIGNTEFVNLMLFPKTNDLAAQGGLLDKCSESKESKLKPGSMVTVFLAKGLIPIGGSGTVTWRDGDSIYIFGHPYFGTGMVNYPFTHVAVADTIQTPLNPYKISGCHLDTKGAMLVDGAFEMVGVVGKTAPTVPFRVELYLNNGGAIMDEEIVPSPMAREIIKQLPVIWAGQLLGDLSSLSVVYQVRMVIQNEPEIFLKNIIPFQVEASPFTKLFNNIDTVFERLNEKVPNYWIDSIDSIKVRVDFVGNLKVWAKKSAFLSQNKATPGETVYANVVLEEISSGDTQQISIPVKVPEDFMERVGWGTLPSITVLVQGGSKFTDKRGLVNMTSVEEFIGQLNQSMSYKTNVLYIQQIMPRSKTEEEVDNANAKASTKTAWKWTDVTAGDLMQFPRDDKNHIILTVSPELNNFIDLEHTFNLMVQSKDDPVKFKEETKKRKWFLFF